MTLLDALEKYPLSTALKGCGLSHNNYRIMRLDASFASAADAAIARREARLLGVIEMATAEDYKAAAWLLERTAGSEFREVKEVETRVKVELERLLDAVEPLMSSGAYQELIGALKSLQTGGPVQAKGLSSGEEVSK